jgi:hypothetical protein
MQTYKCPLCGSPLTKSKYEAVLHIQEEKEKAQRADLEKLHHRLHALQQTETALKKQLKESQQKIKTAQLEGMREGARTEKQRQERLTAGLKKKLALATERIKQLEKGTTPQTEGLEFEENLYKRLRSEFPNDKVEHKGKGGDVLHLVIFEGDGVGTIVYECKRTPKIPAEHVQQAALAKKTREAHFALLVTTGVRKGFSGLAHEDGVLIVAPGGVVPLAHLCRAHLVEMAKAKLDKEEKNRIATQLLEYITSPTHRIPLEQALHETGKAGKLLKREIKDHFSVWQKRYELYQTINWNMSHIQSNLTRVLQGESPASLVKPKLEPLLLPEVTEN